MRSTQSLIIIFIVFFYSSWMLSAEVNVYTSRHYDSDEKLYEDFTDLTGIKVNIISAKGKALIERLRSEGNNSPADLFITVDAGNLWKVQEYGLFQEIKSKKIDAIVPAKFKGKNNEWVALAKRARVIFYNPENLSNNDIQNLSYEDLSLPKWKDKIVL